MLWNPEFIWIQIKTVRGGYHICIVPSDVALPRRGDLLPGASGGGSPTGQVLAIPRPHTTTLYFLLPLSSIEVAFNDSICPRN
jgi:hypothetical protein